MLNISKIVAGKDPYRLFSNPTQASRSLSPLAKILKAEGHKITLKQLMDEWQRQHDLHQARVNARRIDRESPKWHPTGGDIRNRVYPRLKGIAIANCPPGEQGANYTIRDASVTDYSPTRRAWVLHVSGFYKYSSRVGSWHTQASWLAGYDPDQESGYFCRRIPGSIEKVDEALDWLMPAEVKRALDEGRTVIRQGDVYLIQMKRGDNLADLPRRHVWDAEQRMVAHPEHAPIHCPWPVKAIPQKILPTGYGAD